MDDEKYAKFCEEEDSKHWAKMVASEHGDSVLRPL
jgi:hypothetical protein